MPTIAYLTPYNAEFPASGFPQLMHNNRRPGLAYDTSNMELAYWTIPVPSGAAAPYSLLVNFAMASATTGGIALGAVVEAITPGDAIDTDAATSFAANNINTDAAVPGTAGYIDTMLIPLTDVDSAAPGDYFRLGIFRVVAHATDTASGDLIIYTAELRSN